MSKTIVITGSTKGIGLGLAREFLELGCKVVISGRRQEAVDQAVSALAQDFPAERVFGQICDVTDESQVQSLWDAAVAKYGQVNIWINNAGMAHPQISLWDMDHKTVQNVFDANVFGLLNGVRVAVRGMQKQGGGQIYNFEGFGASGRVQKGLGAYGASKSAVAFINKTLAVELEGSPVKVARIQPGMVKTGLVIDQFADDPQGLDKFKPIFNIIASRVNEVAPVLAKRMLEDNKNGAHIQFLSRLGLTLRFLLAPIQKRDLFKEES